MRTRLDGAEKPCGCPLTAPKRLLPCCPITGRRDCFVLPLRIGNPLKETSLAFLGPVSRWVVLAAGCLLAAALLAELAVRRAAPRVCDLLQWRDWECQQKVAAIDALAARGGASIVMIGSSPTNAAFDSHRFTQMNRLERPAFNAALNAASLRTLELWARDVVLPRLRPDVLILGLNSSELSDHNLVGERGYRQFVESRGWRALHPEASIGRRWLLWAEDRSFLVRYRHFFREPGGWGMRAPLRVRLARSMRDPKRLFRKSRGRQVEVTPLGMLHALSVFRGVPYGHTERVLGTWKRIVVDYEVGGHELAALARLADATRDAGVSFVMVLMPVTQDWIDIHPHGREDFDRFRRVLDTFARDHGVPLIDLMPTIPSRDGYADAVHRNDEGRRAFTEMLSSHAGSYMPARARSRADG